MKVLITDDHPIVRKGIRQIIVETFDSIEIDEASSGEETLARVKSERYDIMLLDISLPDINGLDVLKQVRQMSPGTPVLIMSILPEEHYAIKALKYGASGYLAKESASEELVKALKKVLKGGTYVSSTLGEQLAGIVKSSRGPAPHESLSEREFEIMCLIASGKKTGDIAEKLSLSSKTVSSHRSRILDKMNMKNNAELTSYAIQNHLI